MKLYQKVALITGGTSGIGAATVRLFQAEGATVVATGSSQESVDIAKLSLPGVEWAACDQGDPIASKALVEQITKQHGRIDVLFVNAGIAEFAPLEAADEAHFDAILDVNLRGLFFVTKYAVSAMPDGGAILFTGSTAGSRGSPTMSVYSATKAAVRSLARTLGAELAPRNIRVNVVSPGSIDTPIFGKAGLTQEQADNLLEGMRRSIPLGRMGRPEEVAAAALFLAADASFTTGSEVFVGGGMVEI